MFSEVALKAVDLSGYYQACLLAAGSFHRSMGTGVGGICVSAVQLIFQNIIIIKIHFFDF